MRHVTTKLKPQVADHINSWRNYVKVTLDENLGPTHLQLAHFY